MRLLIIRVRDSLRDSFWFLPLVMALLATVGALASVAFDHRIGNTWVNDIGWIWSGGPDGARSVLSTVAGSLMTVISIVFSLTITTLAQTASHFGPRVLRNFTSSRGVQFTLGTFIATFIFCLLVLRTVRSVQESEFVPYLSVNIGVMLTLASLAVLIFFIHHIAQSIQAETLTADVGRAILRSVPSLFADRTTAETRSVQPPAAASVVLEWKSARIVISDVTGYVQNIDDDRLLTLAAEHGKTVRLRARAGDFVWRGNVLVDVLPALPVIDEFERGVTGSFSFGARRTPDQDALYGVQQLVEIAAHALSTGINEPFTALGAIDWLGASLAEMASREFPSVLRVDAQHHPRVLARTLDFRDLMHASFDQIRTYGRSNADIMMRLLDVISGLAPVVVRAPDVETLAYHATLVATDARHIDNAYDRQRVLERHKVVLELCNTIGASYSRAS